MDVNPTKPKPKNNQQNFTEDEIRTRAYQIWLSRNGTSNNNNGKYNPEDDWNAAIESLKLERSRVGGINFLMRKLAQRLFSPFKNPDDRAFNLDVVKTLTSVSSLIATIVAATGLFITSNDNNERLITDRFSKAVEQLGNDKLEIRLGGIYALERISKDSRKDEWTVMEVLTAFVREHSKVSRKTTGEQIPPPPTDIQAVLTVIGRRRLSYRNGEDNHLDLIKTNLGKAYLFKANLQGAYLINANLEEAKLWGANLQGAYLINANLQGAYLINVNLKEAQYTDKSTSQKTCNGFLQDYPCPTIFPPNFDPKAAGMVLKQ
jgi:hypothetical protein